MERIQPRGQLICEIHASPLFATYEGSAADTLPVRLVNRFKGARMGAFEMSHSVQVCFHHVYHGVPYNVRRNG